jgi:hypothetical protein
MMNSPTAESQTVTTQKYSWTVDRIIPKIDFAGYLSNSWFALDI